MDPQILLSCLPGPIIGPPIWSLFPSTSHWYVPTHSYLIPAMSLVIAGHTLPSSLFKLQFTSILQSAAVLESCIDMNLIF